MALAIAAALTACTSASTSTGTAAAAGTSPVHLNGAGSTFDPPFFTKAFAAYQQANRGVAVNYAAVGSSAGISRFAGGTVNFGATDVPASTSDLAGARAAPPSRSPSTSAASASPTTWRPSTAR